MKMTGLIATDLSGTLGGIVASHNRFGTYFRAHVIPTDPSTSLQNAIRTAFTTLVNLWTNTLTDVQRISWNTWAANVPFTDVIGNEIFLTGQNAYIRNNVPRLQAALTRVDAAPTTFNNGNPVTTVQGILGGLGIGDFLPIDGAVVSMQANLSGSASDDGDLIFQVGAPINLSKKFFKGPYQFVSAHALVDAAASGTIDPGVSLSAGTTGPLTLGEKRPMRIRVAYDDGRLSIPFRINGIVTQDTV